MSVAIARRLFSVAEYNQMGIVGILTENDRVELIEGEVVAMSPIGSRHAACVDRLNEELGRRVFGKAILRVQSPVILDDRSEPEPDLSLLRYRSDYYAIEHPTGADVLLIVEVADASSEFDRTVKVPLYARSGIPEVWCVDLRREVIEVSSGPSTVGFRDHCTVATGEKLVVNMLPEVEISVAAVFGR